MLERPPPSRIVGVLGGMGPAATADFFSKLLRATPAERDQDHLRVVIWSDPTVPNRHDALAGAGEDPTPWLERGVETLLGAGAEIVVCPCNTAHAFLPAVLAGRDAESISIIESAVDEVVGDDDGQRVGLLAADGAIASGLYQTALREAGREPVLPTAESQGRLMRLVYAVKADAPQQRTVPELQAVLDELAATGASSVIVGCTELSVLVGGLRTATHVVDASEALARRVVLRARRAVPRDPRAVRRRPGGRPGSAA